MSLKKSLQVFDVFCISIGGMLSGLFILPGLAYAGAGPGVLFSYLLASLISLSGLLSQAELVSAMPRAGGTYFYVTRSLGSAVGTVYGLITWLSMALKIAFELAFMAELIVMIMPVNLYVLEVALVAVFVVVNLVGIKEAGRVQVYLIAALLSALIMLCLRAYPNIEIAHLKPFAPQGELAILAMAGFVFISFGGGLLKATSIAEEVKQPGRSVPLGMIFSLLVMSLLYLVVIFMAVSVQGGRLANSLMPISDTAAVIMGGWGKGIFTTAAILAIVISVNSGIMAASRYPLALARDEMLPRALAEINQRFHTPHFAVILTGAVIVTAMLVNIEALVKAASSVLIMSYIFTCLAVIVLREGKVQNYKPQFRAPLYPWIQMVGVLALIVLLYEIGREALLVSCILTGMGFLVYWFYGRRQAKREYALLHLIERITAKEITTYSLEKELKEIIHERDEILKDRFDHLIEQCPVLDIKAPITMEECFHLTADQLAGSLGADSEELFQLLREREKESPTVLNSFLAIPHIIIPGQRHFNILMARCQSGIEFSRQYPKITTVFVLIGTKDERPFHLNALAAIAQIVQEEDFEKRWMTAKSAQALRDVVLLGKRRRNG